MITSQIVVGIGGALTSEDICALCEAGANEFYLGFVPSSWSDRYGYATSPNRRYSKDFSFVRPRELEETLGIIHRYGRRASLAINEHSYSSQAMEIVLGLFSEVSGLGIDAVIVSDPDLLLKVKQLSPHIPIHASGEMGVYNREAVWQLAEWGAARVVLPRHLDYDEIRVLCTEAQNASLEVEAFMMSERCCFEGAYCFPTHGYFRNHFCNDLGTVAAVMNHRLVSDSQFLHLIEQHLRAYDEWRSHTVAAPAWLGGECGLCAAPKLRNLGVSFFKIVGRGVDGETLAKRIQLVRAALDQDDSVDHREFCRGLVGNPDTCDLHYRCYYRD